MPLRALLLDFDGLVCDTERAAYHSWVEAYREAGFDFPAEVWARMRGRRDGAAVALADLADRLGRPIGPVRAATRLARKRALAEVEPARPGVPELLGEATRRGLWCAVVSGSALSWIDGHLRRLHLRDVVSDVVTGDDIGRPKPAPDGYLAALRRAGFTAAEAVAFEDSAVGVHAAKAAGLRCVAVPSAVGDRNEVAEADLVLDSLINFDLADHQKAMTP